jgi:iron complex transport system permease protein
VKGSQGQFQRQIRWWAGILGIVFAASLLLGRYPDLGLISPERLLSDPLAQRLVLNLRLPRLLAAVLVGMSLATAGWTFQVVLGNPLVEAGLLGVSQGSAFGAALSILVWGSNAIGVQSGAIGFGLLGLALSWGIAQAIRMGDWILRLLLAGIAVSALFSAGVGLLKYLADPLRQLPEITFWLLGGLWSVTWPRLGSVAPVMGLGLAVLGLLRWRLNVLGLDQDVARSLGVPIHRERWLVLGAAVVVTAAAIAVGGLISWVGLLVPHWIRRWGYVDSQSGIPATMLLGGLFVLVCDDLARLLSPGEIPLGILTALLGASGFALLMILKPRP